jgi:hypothetical protein
MREISIWFFIGLSLLVNGALIAAAGGWQLFHVPAHPVVLFDLHANLWWGVLLFLLGLGACIRFSPGKQR